MTQIELKIFSLNKSTFSWCKEQTKKTLFVPKKKIFDESRSLWNGKKTELAPDKIWHEKC